MKRQNKLLTNRFLAALQYRDYRWLWLASMSGASAYWALIVTRGILVLEMSGSSGMVGIVTFAAMAPRFLVPPVAGYLADRFQRRDVLAASYFLNMLNNGVLTVLTFSGFLELWHLMALSLLNGTVRTFQMTSTASLVPNLVPRENMLNAISLNSATQQGARLLGPGIITPLLIISGPGAAFFMSAVFYAFGLLMVKRIQSDSTGTVGSGIGITASLILAAKVVYQNQRLRILFLLVALHCAMTMSFESMFPIFARDVMSSGRVGVSYLMMSVGAGGLLASVLIAGVRGDLTRGRLLFFTGITSGLSLLGLASSPAMTIGIFAAMTMGASQAAFMALVNSMIQMMAPDSMRGRISGLNQINIGGTMAVLNLGNGFIAGAIGSVIVLTSLGIGFTGIMLISLILATTREVYLGRKPTDEIRI